MKITTTHNKWKVTCEVEHYHSTLYYHIIEVFYNDRFISASQVYSKKKRLDPFIWYEAHELYSNTDFHKKITFSEWEEIITTLSELTKLEYKKKK